MILNNLSKYHIILASKSPRRNSFLTELNIKFEVKIKETDETYPNGLTGGEIALHIATKKADAFKTDICDPDLLITADTIVWFNNRVLPKPTTSDQAFKTLRMLSGKRHEVFTGVCVKTIKNSFAFIDKTNVWFSRLSNAEIEWYIEQFKPFDKAGSYGIQDWIGLIGIERIDGSYSNVLGLPVQKLYKHLKNFD